MNRIWNIIKNVIWPVAKPFICADKAEAEELYDFIKPFDMNKVKGRSRSNLPKIYYRIAEALEND